MKKIVTSFVLISLIGCSTVPGTKTPYMNEGGLTPAAQKWEDDLGKIIMPVFGITSGALICWGAYEYGEKVDYPQPGKNVGMYSIYAAGGIISLGSMIFLIKGIKNFGK